MNEPLNTAHQLIKRSFTLSGHNTSIALEKIFWDVIDHIAATRATTHTHIIAHIDGQRSLEQSLASAIRTYCMTWALKQDQQMMP